MANRKDLTQRIVAWPFGRLLTSIPKKAGLAKTGPAGLAAIGLFFLLVPVADVTWQSRSGDRSVASNWRGNLLPTSTGNAWIVNGGTATGAAGAAGLRCLGDAGMEPAKAMRLVF